MKINHHPIERTCPEVEVFESILSLDHKTILELGCGDATLTRLIATAGEARQLTATEVDTVQHEKNLLIEDLSNVKFVFAGGQNIPLSNGSVDTVFMFKSLHHVPVEAMGQTFEEIHRVLKPGGIAYISEPIFAGDLNEIYRIFHDEEKVRYLAFEAIRKVVSSQKFSLKEQLFFNTPRMYESYEQFYDQVAGISYNDFQLSDSLLEKIEWKFKQMVTKNGGEFITPIRVDLLQKPA